MPSAKHNSTMDKAMGLISSLFNTSRDVPFRQLQCVQYTHHRLAFVLCVLVLFARCPIHDSVMWLPYSFVGSAVLIACIFCSNWMDFQRHFLYCFSFVMLCNGQSIAEDKA